MPLTKSASSKAIGPNIKREEAAGKPYKQALAIALSTQDRARRLAAGGASLAAPAPPYYERSAMRDMQHNDQYHSSGLFKSDVAGRTDRLPRAVPADSFVFPADTISGLGSGNTLAGAKLMDAILSSGPYGAPLPRSKRATGGAAHDGTTGISKVLVAGGEYLANPDQLRAIGRRMRAGGKSRARTDLAAGHEWARAFVDKVRAQQKSFLKTAPKPKP